MLSDPFFVFTGIIETLIIEELSIFCYMCTGASAVIFTRFCFQPVLIE